MADRLQSVFTGQSPIEGFPGTFTLSQFAHAMQKPSSAIPQRPPPSFLWKEFEPLLEAMESASSPSDDLVTAAVVRWSGLIRPMFSMLGQKP